MPADHNPILLEAKNLSLSPLWKGLCFTLGAGEMLQIIGDNGVGKTSLIRTLCGLIRPDEGQVLWRRRDIRQHAEDYHGDVAYVGHKDGLKNSLTPTENLSFAAAIRGRGETAGGVSIKDALRLWGLADLLVPCRTLSAGQCRRTALARLLLFGARLWFLDEPLTALDRTGGDTLGDMIANHLSTGGSVVMSTHQAPDWPFSPQILSLRAR